MGIIGMLRVYQIYYGSGALDLTGMNQVLVWLGAISILMGAFFAIFQEDIKLMLAYSTISNIGYIVMGLGLATPYSVIGASVHVFNHALIKSTLFLASGRPDLPHRLPHAPRPARRRALDAAHERRDRRGRDLDRRYPADRRVPLQVVHRARRVRGRAAALRLRARSSARSSSSSTTSAW